MSETKENFQHDQARTEHNFKRGPVKWYEKVFIYFLSQPIYQALIAMYFLGFNFLDLYDLSYGLIMHLAVRSYFVSYFWLIVIFIFFINVLSGILISKMTFLIITFIIFSTFVNQRYKQKIYNFLQTLLLFVAFRFVTVLFGHLLREAAQWFNKIIQEIQLKNQIQKNKEMERQPILIEEVESIDTNPDILASFKKENLSDDIQK